MLGTIAIRGKLVTTWRTGGRGEDDDDVVDPDAVSCRRPCSSVEQLSAIGWDKCSIQRSQDCAAGLLGGQLFLYVDDINLIVLACMRLLRGSERGVSATMNNAATLGILICVEGLLIPVDSRRYVLLPGASIREHPAI